jgi:hypothetical protein
LISLSSKMMSEVTWEESERPLGEFLIEVTRICRQTRTWFFLERASGSAVEQDPLWGSLIKAAGQQSSTWTTDFCADGSSMRRRTSITSNASWMHQVVRSCPGCTAHSGPRGLGEDERAGAFPVPLAERWATVMKKELEERGVKGLGPVTDEEKVLMKPGQKLRPPDLPSIWGSPELWQVAIRGKWKRREHINVLEARAAVQAARRLGRTEGARGKKALGITDSRVVQGAFSKGRSSSSSLQPLCRRLAAIQLGLRIRIRWRWISTKFNCSDAPSRGRKHPGVV